jgi:hypothetical protein
MSEIVPFNGGRIGDGEDEPHEVYEAICIKCHYRYVAVSPVDMEWLKNCPCPECKEVGGLIRTGQPITEYGDDAEILEFPGGEQ